LSLKKESEKWKTIWKDEARKSLKQEIENEIRIDSQKEILEFENKFLELEKTYKISRENEARVEKELIEKTATIGEYSKEVEELKKEVMNLSVLLDKNNSKYIKLKEKHSNRVQLDLIDKEMRLHYIAPKDSLLESKESLLSYATCLAAALETFLHH
jgi:hypothetical protein